MNASPSLHVPSMALPESAPQLRITAGLGTASQKTWNLRRPVTLIGSRRPAHIVLHDRDISHAHCVLLNTGSEVLLKDLYTSSGTFVNNQPVDVVVLKDGDVLRIGNNRVQVAIQFPRDASDDSACGVTYTEPTQMPRPVKLSLVHTDQQWSVRDAVTLIGRHPLSPICLDHEQVSRRHAIIFPYKKRPAVFDLGGQNGIMVNGRLCPHAPLTTGDRVTVGPFGLEIHVDGDAAPQPTTDTRPPAAAKPVFAEPEPPKPAAPTSETPKPDNNGASRPQSRHSALPSATPADAPDVAEMVDRGLDSLQDNIRETWTRLNSWESRLMQDSDNLSKQEQDLTAWEKALDARDAALRGQLHDVQRFEEQLAEREKELQNLRSKVQAEKADAERILADAERREAELNRRIQELSRREHVFAQRWTRLSKTKCTYCGRPFTLSEGG